MHWYHFWWRRKWLVQLSSGYTIHTAKWLKYFAASSVLCISCPLSTDLLCPNFNLKFLTKVERKEGSYGQCPFCIQRMGLRVIWKLDAREICVLQYTLIDTSDDKGIEGKSLTVNVFPAFWLPTMTSKVWILMHLVLNWGAGPNSVKSINSVFHSPSISAVLQTMT